MPHNKPKIAGVVCPVALTSQLDKEAEKEVSFEKESSRKSKKRVALLDKEPNRFSYDYVLLNHETGEKTRLEGISGDSKPGIESSVSQNIGQPRSPKQVSDIVLAVKALIANASPDERAQISSIARASVLPDYDQQLVVESMVKERWKKKPSNFSGSASDFVSTYYGECIKLRIVNRAMLRRIDEDLYHAYYSRILVHAEEDLGIPTKNDLVIADLDRRKIKNSGDLCIAKSTSPKTPASKRENERTRGMLRSMGL